MKYSFRLSLLAATCLMASTALAQASNPIIDTAMSKADALEQQVIEWRRHIHQNPELSYQEHNTAAYIKAALETMPGYEIQTGIAQTGIKAVLKGGKPGPVVALRADMDALPVQERNDLPFKSTAKGTWQGKEVSVSHACGHDTHVAMLLGAAKVFSDMRAELPGTIVLLFQPAEEQGPGKPLSGANAMMAEGVLDKPKVDVVMGQHIGPSYPAGSIGYRQGSLMASGDVFSISLAGKGGHGSSPWNAASPVVAAAETVVALNNIIAQRTNPQDGTTVVTVGSLQSGNRPNVLPESADISGTVRSLSKQNQATAHELIQRYAQNIAANHDLKATVRIDTGYEVLVSDPKATQTVIPALDLATDGIGAKEVPPGMGSEDFGAFGKNVPVVFWRLNASPYSDKMGSPNHSPEFMIDEKALRIGTRALLASSLTYMTQSNKP
ncbi:MAG: amidohydrolase [Alcaligenes sp.]|nr:amidohydrolase [Alcaligenes sp.]